MSRESVSTSTSMFLRVSKYYWSAQRCFSDLVTGEVHGNGLGTVWTLGVTDVSHSALHGLYLNLWEFRGLPNIEWYFHLFEDV